MHGLAMGILGSLAITIVISDPWDRDPRHPRAQSNNSEAWSDGREMRKVPGIKAVPRVPGGGAVKNQLFQI